MASWQKLPRPVQLVLSTVIITFVGSITIGAFLFAIELPGRTPTRVDDLRMRLSGFQPESPDTGATRRFNESKQHFLDVSAREDQRLTLEAIEDLGEATEKLQSSLRNEDAVYGARLGQVRTALALARVSVFDRSLPMFLDYSTRFIGVLASWPLVVLVLVSIFLTSQTALDRLSLLFGRFRSIKLMGLEAQFGPGNALQVSTGATSFFRRLRAETNQTYAIVVRKHDLWDAMRRVVVKAEEKIRVRSGRLDTSIRATIHMPDVLFGDTLCQLVDYYPEPKGAGRIWSLRYGIIGRAWRAETDMAQGKVTTDPAELVAEWGMTLPEAKSHGHSRKSFMCILLRDEDAIEGILYLDAVSENAFGREAELDTVKAEMSKLCNDAKLGKLVREIRLKLLDVVPTVAIYDGTMASSS